MPATREQFIRIMSAFPTGVAIVTTVDADGTPRGLTTNAVTSVSAEPPILLICIDEGSRTLSALRASPQFAVNFMGDDCEEVCRLFATKADDKFERVEWTPGAGGVPILAADAVAFAECTRLDEFDVGDHVVITGLVEGGSPPEPDSSPIVYFRKRFHPPPPSVESA
jgi:flavin reductase (DIM6/NTAB) family NADH-FMN oxidoreductase RutF